MRRPAGDCRAALSLTRLCGEVADHPAEERAVRVGAGDQARVDLDGRLSGRPVGGVIVLAAEVIIVHTLDAAGIVCA